MAEPMMPESEDDLPQPFERIGEAGWADRTRELLDSFGIPIPTPTTVAAIAAAERRLGVRLPEAYRRFLLELGPMDLDGFRFLSVDSVTTLELLGFRAWLTPNDAGLLSKFLGVMEYAGVDLVGLEYDSGRCALCRHDPPGFSDGLPDFDSLVKVALLSIPVSKYGWPDESVDELVRHAQMTRYGTRL